MIKKTIIFLTSAFVVLLCACSANTNPSKESPVMESLQSHGSKISTAVAESPPVSNGSSESVKEEHTADETTGVIVESTTEAITQTETYMETAISTTEATVNTTETSIVTEPSENSQPVTKEEIVVLEPTGLVLTLEEFATHLSTYLPSNCYISSINKENSTLEISGGVDVKVLFDNENHSYKDSIAFYSDNVSDITYLLEYIIPTVDPKVTGSELSNCISRASSLLKSKEDGAVLLNTGVGYVHVSKEVNTGTMTIPSNYWFYFFTLQYAME